VPSITSKNVQSSYPPTVTNGTAAIEAVSVPTTIETTIREPVDPSRGWAPANVTG
jgi:hypothetical protein